MHTNKLAGWILAAVLAIAATPALAQHEEGPILLPKPKPQPKPVALSATLLVMCDLACNWKLDGEAKGRIEAGGSVKVKVEFGQHVVVAVTEDRADQVKQISKVNAGGQTVVSIELKLVRDARLKTEQETKDKAAQETQEARNKAEREAREKVMREEAAGAWTDPATSLMWTKKNNGSDVNWQQATDYCRNLQLAGYSGWRLPMIDELKGIYDSNINSPGQWRDGTATTWHVKGNLQLSGDEWSNTQDNAYSYTEAWIFNFRSGHETSTLPGSSATTRAHCVRYSGE
ncbi:MAG: DUF1566 domain-containing protein [Terracidiphilus sp.]|jgi:hypothetical protein